MSETLVLSLFISWPFVGWISMLIWNRKELRSVKFIPTEIAFSYFFLSGMFGFCVPIGWGLCALCDWLDRKTPGEIRNPFYRRSDD